MRADAQHDHGHDEHHHHDGPQGRHGCGQCAEGATERAERLCRARGLQFTPLRRDVLAVVAAEGRPLGAYDIAERMSGPGGRPGNQQGGREGRRVAAVSVYRALDFLTEQGLVHRISSRNAFVSCGHDHGDGASLVFLICRQCGGIDEMTAPAVERALDRTLAQAGFTPTSRILEVEGECGACRGRGEREAPDPG